MTIRQRFFLSAGLGLAVFGMAAHAATISLAMDFPTVIQQDFDVRVQVTDVFAGRDPGDALLAYGFNVTVGSGLVTYVGEDAGPLFTDFSASFGGNPAVAGISNSILGLSSGDFAEPLTLAILHFTANGLGATSIGVTYDPGDLNQGLFYLNSIEPISASRQIDVTPEPATFALAGLALAALCVAGVRRGHKA